MVNVNNQRIADVSRKNTGATDAPGPQQLAGAALQAVRQQAETARPAGVQAGAAQHAEVTRSAVEQVLTQRFGQAAPVGADAARPTAGTSFTGRIFSPDFMSDPLLRDPGARSARVARGAQEMQTLLGVAANLKGRDVTFKLDDPGFSNTDGSYGIKKELSGTLVDSGTKSFPSSQPGRTFESAFITLNVKGTLVTERVSLAHQVALAPR
jgi:hypothetical protein